MSKFTRRHPIGGSNKREFENVCRASSVPATGVPPTSSERVEVQEYRGSSSQPSVSYPERESRRSVSAPRVHFAIPAEEFFIDDFPVEVEEITRDLDTHCHDVQGKKIVDYHCARKKTVTGIGVVGVFMMGEAFGGYLASSLAVTTDACRLLGDFAGFLASLFSLYMVEKGETRSLNYGSGRAEVIGALVSLMIIWSVSIILICLSLTRFVVEEAQIDTRIMMITSGIGIVENIIIAMFLHQDIRHPWDMDPEKAARLVDSTGSSLVSASKSNINITASLKHVHQGFLHSIGVFTAAAIIFVKPDWQIADPICTVIFSSLIILSTNGALKKILRVLMEGTPYGINYEKVRGALLEVEDVVAIHNLRMWSVSMAKIAISVHVAIKPGGNVDKMVLREASRVLKVRFGFQEVTIQIEEFNSRMAACDKCRDAE